MTLAYTNAAPDGNTEKIAFRPTDRMNFPAIFAERAGLLEVWHSPDVDAALRQRVGQRLIALNRALVFRFGAVMLP